MLLRIIGECGPYPKPLGATSCYLLETENNKIVLDMGSGAFSKLSDIVKPEEISAIVISHFHADHSADLAIFAIIFNNSKSAAGFRGVFPFIVLAPSRRLRNLRSRLNIFRLRK